MNGYPYKSRRSLQKLSQALSLAVGLASIVLLPYSVSAQEGEAPEPETLSWARIDYIRNRVQLVPRDQNGRRARISDVLSVGDSLRTARASRAELRFNDGSLARVGERAIFRFTPNTRNFQLSNGTILLLIPPGRGRSTIQTPNATTGIQGSALFVRYIPETDTTIVGALTNNPNGPMVLINRDGTESQALRANEIGVIKGDQITELYEFDGTLFWQSSGLAEGFNYLSDTSSSGNPDQLDGVRREIREAISTQGRLSGDTFITNPDEFNSSGGDGLEGSETPAEPEFNNSPAQEYLEGDVEIDESEIDIGADNNLSSIEPEDEGSEGIGEEASGDGQSSEQQVNGSGGSQAESGGMDANGTETSGTETNGTETSGTEASSTNATEASETSTTGNDIERGEGTANTGATTGATTTETTSEDVIVEPGTAGAGTSSGPGDAVESGGNTTINGDVTPNSSNPANDAGSSAPAPEVNTAPSSGSSSGEISPLPSEGTSMPPGTGSTAPSSESPGVSSGPSLDNSHVGNDSSPPIETVVLSPAESTDIAASEAAAVSDSVANAGAEVPVAASTTLDSELMTIPEGDVPLTQPVPDVLEELDDAQPIVDMEMDNMMEDMDDDAMSTMGQ
ncbi:MAG: FecR domain-containing protein [Cyanobacteria bacterium J06648_10]